MRKMIYALLLLPLAISCNHQSNAIADRKFIDSLLLDYQEPAAIKANVSEVDFWQRRINPKVPGLVNETKYAGALVQRFHLKGDIADLIRADSILLQIDSLYNYKEATPNLSMALHCLLQHRFNEATVWFQKAKAIGIKKYESHAVAFDVNFESGLYANALANLNAIKAENNYGYQFRKSKWEHYKGNMDSAIQAMQNAVALSGGDIALKQAALSNTADLYLHNSELEKANKLYMESIRLNTADLHSIMGLGWITLVHDHNDSLAEKIFFFVSTKTSSPDPYFKLAQTASARGDSNLQKKYASRFANQVEDSAYGNMYNKYLIELYTGILNNPERAEVIAKRELSNRATPQTYSWYAWSLFSNNKQDEAYKIYQKRVSGKPLEGLELYWMGKMMQAMNKGYNAKQYFKEAYKNRYDLSPEKVIDLETESGIK